MPKLPSGIELAISKDALFDHGGNWFNCPDGHFWHWFPDSEMGDPPFDTNNEILLIAQHEPVPKDREEAKRFVHVLEINSDQENYHWRGEWLAWFPRYTELKAGDLTAWIAWLDTPNVAAFLDNVIEECERLAEVSRHASGYAHLHNARYEKVRYEGELRTDHRR